MSAAPLDYPVEHRRGVGETIVLLHGGNVANWSWSPQVDGFTEFHVLTPHHPGFGTRAGDRREKEDSSVRRSFGHLRELAPRTQCRLAPGLHHAGSIENVDLFNDMVRGWVHGEVDDRLLPG